MNEIQVKRKKEKVERKEISDFEKTRIHNIWILGWFSKNQSNIYNLKMLVYESKISKLSRSAQGLLVDIL
jgi:hypothetical protein